MAIRNVENEKLRIWEYYQGMNTPPNVLTTDFTLIGLKSLPSIYSVGGVKKQHDYLNSNDELVVSKKFSYNGTGATITFEWYDLDNNIGLSKEVFKPMSPVQVANLRKKNRDRTLMYLKATAEGTPIAGAVAEILSHYKYSIEVWLLNGTDEWATAILTEPEFEGDGVTPNPIYNYLNILTVPPSEKFPEGFTVKSGILYQIKGIYDSSQ